MYILSKSNKIPLYTWRRFSDTIYKKTLHKTNHHCMASLFFPTGRDFSSSFKGLDRTKIDKSNGLHFFSVTEHAKKIRCGSIGNSFLGGISPSLQYRRTSYKPFSYKFSVNNFKKNSLEEKPSVNKFKIFCFSKNPDGFFSKTSRILPKVKSFPVKKSWFYTSVFGRFSICAKSYTDTSIDTPKNILPSLAANNNLDKLISIEYSLDNFHRSNQDTCLVHKPSVFEGQWVQSGDLLADCSASVGGELALGQNILIAYMPWEGYNFEDAILVSERLVYDDLYTSVHIERYEVELRETKLGFEEITREIPDVPEVSCNHLNESGIAKLGSWVEEGDILVGKVTPINKKSQSNYQKLLYTILDKTVLPIRDSSLRAPKGIKAKVIGIQIFSLAAKTYGGKFSTYGQKNSKSITSEKKTSNIEVRNSPLFKNINFLSNKKPKTLNDKESFISNKSAGEVFSLKRTLKKNIEPKKTEINFNKFSNQMSPSEASVGILSDDRGPRKLPPFFFSKPDYIKYNQVLKKGLDRPERIRAIEGDRGQEQIEIYNQNNILIDHNKFKFFSSTKFSQRQKLKFKGYKPFNKITPFTYLDGSNMEITNNFKKNELSKEKTLNGDNQNDLIKNSLPMGLNKQTSFEKKNYKISDNLNFLKKFLEKSSDLKSNQSTDLAKNPLLERQSQIKTSPAWSISPNKKKVLLKNLKGVSSIQIFLAEKRRIQVGDKMAGRHGNKGIISQILPIEDMPFLPDGRPLDMVLNPLGVPSRMNVGQIYECLLGLAGKHLGENFKVFPFDEIYGAEASRSFVYSKLYAARTKTGKQWLFNQNSPGKIRLYDGRTGETFDQAITVGYAYMLRLVHMVDDKIHARSTGPYSLVTQQPLRGRSKQGGQRLGEMEVWALEGYGAAFTLLEMLTIKSDDMTGRMTLWSNLILNKEISIGTPESFKVLICELQALCLDIGLFKVNSTKMLKT